MIISVDNYGLLVVNLFTMKISQTVVMKSLDTRFGDVFEISRILPLSGYCLRVFIKNLGSFSIVWDRIDLTEDANVFRGLRTDNYAEDFTNRITTSLIAGTGTGYAQIIYRRESRGFMTAFVRIFNVFNRPGSKILNEFSIGRVAFCNTIETRNLNNYWLIRVVVICGTMLYVNEVDLYPELAIQSLTRTAVEPSGMRQTRHLIPPSIMFNITAKNFASQQTVVIHLEYENFSYMAKNMIIALIFVAVMIVL